MAHDVTIDDDAVDAAFSEFESGAPGAGAPPGAGQLMPPEPTPSEWQQIAKMAAQLMANAITPNWDVPAEVQDQWAEAFAGCLDQLFPGGLANIANWGPWAKLAYASVMWGMCGVDLQTGTLKPLRPPKEGAGQEAVPAAGELSPVAAAAAGGRHMMG